MSGLELLLQIIYDNSNARGEGEWVSVSKIHKQLKDYLFDDKEIRELLEASEQLGWVKKQNEVTLSYRVTRIGERILERWRRDRLDVGRC